MVERGWRLVLVLGDQEGEQRGKTMLQISDREFEWLPLRAHQFLTAVPLHAVWAVDLPSPRTRVTLDEFLRVASDRIYTPAPLARGLLDLRLLMGRLFAWDRPRTPADLLFVMRHSPSAAWRQLQFHFIGGIHNLSLRKRFSRDV
jgi:hypothetical protein